MKNKQAMKKKKDIIREEIEEFILWLQDNEWVYNKELEIWRDKMNKSLYKNELYDEFKTYQYYDES